MSKKFKGQTCIYCGREGAAETADHIFARQFFLESRRQNLPQAPACKDCNAKKSADEHYLATVLPFGGRHKDAGENLTTKVPRRLEKNVKLHRELNAGTTEAWIKESSGLYVRSTLIPFDGERFERLFGFIVKGLMWHHWGVILASDAFVEVLTLTPHGKAVFDQKLQMNANQRIEESLGNGTFTYRAAQAKDNLQVSIWQIEVYGGIIATGTDSAEKCSTVGVFTGPNQIKERAAARAAVIVT